MQDWYKVHDQAMFHAPVAPDQVAPWQFVKGPITDNEAMVLAQRAAITPLADLLIPFRHWRLCVCYLARATAREGHFTHRGMQIGRRKIQSLDDGIATVPPNGSEQDTWMQAYTRRLLLEHYDTHMLWMNAQRTLRPLTVDGAQASNRSTTQPMRGSPMDRERRTVPLDKRDSSIQIYHPVFSSDNMKSIASLELAMQVVFDHAQSQLPNAIAKRVLNRWRQEGDDDNQGPPRPCTAGFIYMAFHTATQEIRQPPVLFSRESVHKNRERKLKKARRS
jgi:hypothetical protein